MNAIATPSLYFYDSHNKRYLEVNGDKPAQFPNFNPGLFGRIKAEPQLIALGCASVALCSLLWGNTLSSIGAPPLIGNQLLRTALKGLTAFCFALFYCGIPSRNEAIAREVAEYVKRNGWKGFTAVKDPLAGVRFISLAVDGSAIV